MIEAHETIRHLTEVIITQGHVCRTESTEFLHNKDRLKADGHFKCWVCGSTEDLQVHHFGCEWSLQNVCDFEKLKAFCEEWDPYGYGKLLKNIPIASADDVRNMLVLCLQHRLGGTKDGVANGIHEITFPAWVIQKLANSSEDPVPQEGEKPEQVLEQIKAITKV